jgi:GxxExxY protein
MTITWIKNQMEEEKLTKRIIGCCFKVHRELGPGFNEKIYHTALKLEFKQEGLRFQTEKEFEVSYLDQRVGTFRADLVVEDKVVLEIKSLEGKVSMVFGYQLLSYLKASGLRVGLLVNFGNKSCQVKRLVY